MPVAKKENLSIELPRIDVQLMEITLIGDTPLIVHAWSSKAKKEMLDKQMKRPKQAKTAKNPVNDFEESLYRLPDGGYGFPSVAFKNAAATAALTLDGLKKAQVLRAFHVMGEDIDVTGAFDGVKMRQNLVRIEGGRPRMREDMVRVGMGTADLRYRGEFSPWWAKVLVRFNAAALSGEQLLALFNAAGFAIGIGEWRSEKGGQSGLFHVATEAENLRDGTGGRLMQIAGFEFSEGSRFQTGAKADNPDLIGRHIDFLRKQQKGELEPKNVVDDARNPNSPLHSFFEWDDGAAAERYRLDQARGLIRSVVAVYTRLEEPAQRMKAFIHVPEPGAPHYRETSHALSQKKTRELVLQRAWREFQAWRSKYKDLKEFADLITVADEVAKKLPRVVKAN